MKKLLLFSLFCLFGSAMLCAQEPLLLGDEPLAGEMTMMPMDSMPAIDLAPVEEVVVPTAPVVEEPAPVALTVADGTLARIGSLTYLLYAADRTAIVTAETPDRKHSYELVGDLSVPEVVRYADTDFTVTQIADSAFFHCPSHDLKRVVLPSSLVRIGSSAFEGASSLESVEFGDRLDMVGERAFRNCRHLSVLVCRSSVAPLVGNEAFDGVEKGAPLYVPSSSAFEYRLDENWSRFEVTEIAPERVTARVADESLLETASDGEFQKNSILKRYYNFSGRSWLSILSVGYSTSFLVPTPAGMSATEYSFNRHLLNASIFEWRAAIFGMSLFNFEMGLNTPNDAKGQTLLMRGAHSDSDLLPNELSEAKLSTMWFAYKPTVKFYAPVSKCVAVEFYGGVEVDACLLWDKINTGYYSSDPMVPLSNFFMAGFGGLGFMFTALPNLPLEIKAEYRHPFQVGMGGQTYGSYTVPDGTKVGNLAIIPQGIYLSAQFHIATPIQKKKKQQF